jgi:eukaryotic-like serine/threonine-protein kinase
VDTRLANGTAVAGRYEVRACLGTGGMGVVYEVLDRRSDEAIALKTLRPGVADPQLLRREFRALADIAHPNLVQLFELFDDAGRVCLTMELVPGVDLMTELRGAEHALPTLTLAGPADDTQPVATRAAPPGALDTGRVRDRFAQLARGLVALHRRGVVHRDLKPHNVRVTPEGRVVLLDFGIASPAGGTGPLAGTIAYIAPEQADGAPVEPSADWYSFGVLLHEVLAGQLPWTGNAFEVLQRKRTAAPPPIAHDAPADLAALIAALMRVEPGERLAGDAVLDRLGARRAPRTRAIEQMADAELVGRRAELAQLLATWRAVAAGGCAWVAIEGDSGVGKTTLLAALERACDDAVVLHGRCYEREAVPYKGIDQIVDAAVARLVAERRELAEAADLTAAFPAVQALVPAGAEAGGERRGAALRALVAALAEGAPVLLALDDVQWADRDCLALLEHALAPPGVARVLVVVTARPDAGARWHELPMPFVRLPLGALPDGEAVELAQALLGRAAATIDPIALARRAGGHPIELQEHVRAALTDTAAPPLAGGGRALLFARVAHAPVDVRRVVELIAVAGAPAPVAAIARASDLTEPALHAALGRARLAGLVRTLRKDGRSVVEPAHDRVREVVFGALSALERAQRATLLAPALEQLAHDPAHVADLYALAGRPDEARRCAEAAARRMTAVAAHDAAAGMWRRVAELSAGAARRAARRAMADALALAGRGSEAADLYRALADGAADARDRVHCLRRAGEELLRAGRFAEGLALVERHVPGWREPRTAATALARGLALHAATRAGLLPRAGAGAEHADMVELRWAVASGYTLGSPGHFTLAVERYLRAALALGDPERIALGWAAEAALATFMGSAGFAERCLSNAATALGGRDAPRVRMVVLASSALMRLNEGAWARAEALVDEAIAIADRRAPNLVWERNTATMGVAISRFHRGACAQLVRDVRRERERIAARGDLYAHELAHSGFTVVADLALANTAHASELLVELDARPTGVMTAWLRAIAHALVGAYGERTSLHRARTDALLGGWLALPLVRSPLLHGTLAWTRAALELAHGGTDIRRWVARLRATPARGMAALADLLAGHAALLAGDRAAARRLGATAELALVADDMPLFAASARWLVDPTTWPAWRDALAHAGVVDPERFARIVAPALR